MLSACLWWNNSTTPPADGTALYLMYTSTDFFNSAGLTILTK